ncbi:hypothetical protein ACFL4T_11360 [candidate division KSB1 bacterium]
MILLLLAIISSFTIGILIKINELKGAETRVVLAANYIIASIIGWIFVIYTGSISISTSTFLIGGIGGVLWPVMFFSLMWGVRIFGLSIVGSVIRISLIIPVMFAVVFLSETLSVFVILGIIGTFLAFYLLRKPAPDTKTDKRAFWFFPLIVIGFGITDLWVNIFNNYGVESEKFLFMVLIFTFSAVITLAVNFLQKIKSDKGSVMRGVILGIPNFFSTFFLMESLKTAEFVKDSAAAYTIYAAFGVFLAFSAGAVFWKERVTVFNVLGAAAAICAIILLNFG